jgi:divalent metal cation (Fe/Co/Zn/Cd) transporter
MDGVKGIKEIKGRNYGNNEVVDVSIFVDSTLDIKKAHGIADDVETELQREYGVYQVHVHVEPQ